MNQCGIHICENDHYCDTLTNPSKPTCTGCTGIQHIACICENTQNCAVCGDTSNSCGSCLKGFNDEQEEGICVKNCIDSDCTDGTYCDSVGSCKVCKYSCATCKGNFHLCTSCANGFYQTGDTCSQCVAGQAMACTCDAIKFCATCGVGKCETCMKGYEKKVGSDECVAAVVECPQKDCQNGEYCENGKCTACQTGISSPCRCGGTEENLCATCIDPASKKCSTCIKNGAFVPDINGSCKKPLPPPVPGCSADSCGEKKYCDYSDKTCKECDDKCQTCNQKDYCITCAHPGFILPSCTICEDNYALNQDRCNKCTPSQTTSCKCGPFQNCATCDLTDPKNPECSSCIPGYFGKKCYSCAHGYYQDDKQCKKCPTGCKNCSSKLICKSCENNYIMYLNACNICTSTQFQKCTCGGIQNCSTCDDRIPGTPKCKTCLAGYYLKDNCEKCDDKAPQGACSRCAEGFELTMDQTCQISCDTLQDGQTCLNGVARACGIEGQTTRCQCGDLDNCFTCEGNQCKSCMKTFKITDGKCNECENGYKIVGELCVLDEEKSNISLGAIIGIVIGSVITIICIIIGAYYCTKKLRNQKSNQFVEQFEHNNIELDTST